MREEIKSNFFEMINVYKQLIKFNRDKIMMMMKQMTIMMKQMTIITIITMKKI